MSSPPTDTNVPPKDTDAQAVKMRRRRLIVKLMIVEAIIIMALFVGIAIYFTSRPSGPISAGPMIQLPAQDGFTVVWKTTLEEPLQLKVAPEEIPDATQVLPAGCEKGICRVDVSGLEPGTRYTYAVRTTTEPVQTLAEGVTRTDPGPGQPFRFIAFGDSGSGYKQQFDLAKVMVKQDPDLVVHTGDLIYPEGAAEDYVPKFYEPYEGLIRRAAFMPAIGNHDFDDTGGGPLLDNFVLPENGPTGPQFPLERCYWFDFGDVRFFCLDSNVSFATLRDTIGPWLDEQLGKATNRWKVIYFHHPVYTNSKYTAHGSIRQVVLPLADKWHVELILLGHAHMYERSKPMHNDEIAEPGHGTVHITTGAGGGKLTDIPQPTPDFLVKQDNSQHSFTLFDVTPETMHIRQVALDETVMDDFKIAKRTPPLPEAVVKDAGRMPSGASP